MLFKYSAILEDKDCEDEIHIEDEFEGILDKVRQFLYDGGVEIQKTVLVSFSKFALDYLVTSLMRACESGFVKCVEDDKKSSSVVAPAARACCSDPDAILKCEDASLQFLIEKKVPLDPNNPLFLDAGPEAVKSYLANPYLVCSNEREVLGSLVRWVMQKEEDRLQHFDNIAKASIRTYMLSVIETEKVAKNKKLKRSHPLTKKMRALPNMPVDSLLVNRQECDVIDGTAVVSSRQCCNQCMETVQTYEPAGLPVQLDTRQR